MTTNQITTLARAKILETTSDIISDATILIYANLAYQDIIRRAFPNDQIATATITFTGGVGTLPSDFGTLYGDAFQDVNYTFPELSIDDFQKQTAGRGVTIENATIKVYPTTTTSLTIKYYKSYPDLTSAVNPTINSYLHEPIVYGIIYRAQEDLQDEQLAAFYEAKYNKILEDKIANLSQYEEGNQRGGQLFVEQSLISDNSLLGSDPNFF